MPGRRRLTSIDGLLIPEDGRRVFDGSVPVDRVSLDDIGACAERDYEQYVLLLRCKSKLQGDCRH
jgi:hypothetical protein